MASRSLNKVFLIGNLTKDPELRYTPQGTAVCSFGLATNRAFVTEGEKREETEFHRLVAWNKLAELCSQLLKKGTKVHVEGRLQTRSWQAPDGANRQTTEIVIEDMMILTPKGMNEGGSMDFDSQDPDDMPAKSAKKPAADEDEDEPKAKKGKKEEEVADEDFDDLDIPF